MKIFSFEKLIDWQKSRKLTIKIYKFTKGFPNKKRFRLTSQMRRCAVSNIAEGTGRYSRKDKARFTEIANGSALKPVNQAILSNDLEFLSEDNYKNHTRVHH